MEIKAIVKQSNDSSISKYSPCQSKEFLKEDQGSSPKMRSVNNNLQRHQSLRQEQLELRNSLSIVYDVIRDLGLHYELIEIPGCSKLTIGRSHHRFSHLDKDLAWTAQAERMGNVDNVYQNTAVNRDSSASEDEEKMNLEKLETETNQLKQQLSNIASQLKASKDTEAALNAYIRDAIALDDEVKRNLQMQVTENKLLLGQLADLSVKIQASKDEEKALLTQNRTLEEQKEENESKLRYFSRKLQKEEDATKELRDKMNAEYTRMDNDYQIRRSESAFAEQNLRLQEKKFAKLACQLADAETERLLLKKEKLKWCNDMEEAAKTEVGETLQAAELSQQQTNTALHQVSKDHEKALKAAAELETLLEIAKQEAHERQDLLTETINKLEEAENELSRINEKAGKFPQTDRPGKKETAASEPKNLDDEREVENKKILKGNKALKQRIASLEEEKVRSLAILNELKSEATSKFYERIALSDELDRKTEKVNSLKEALDEKIKMVKVVTAQKMEEGMSLREELDEETEKGKVATGQKIGLEKKVKKLLKEIEQLTENHELNLACLRNKLHHGNATISVNNPEKEEPETGNETPIHIGKTVEDSNHQNHQGQDSAAHDTLNPPDEPDPLPLVKGQDSAAHATLNHPEEPEPSPLVKGQDSTAHDTLNPPDEPDPLPLVCRNNNSVTQRPAAATVPDNAPVKDAEKAATEQAKNQDTDDEKTAPDRREVKVTETEKSAAEPEDVPATENATATKPGKVKDVENMTPELSQEVQGVKLYYNRLVQASDTISNIVAELFIKTLHEDSYPAVVPTQGIHTRLRDFELAMDDKVMDKDFLAEINDAVEDASKNTSESIKIKDLAEKIRDQVDSYNRVFCSELADLFGHNGNVFDKSLSKETLTRIFQLHVTPRVEEMMMDFLQYSAFPQLELYLPRHWLPWKHRDYRKLNSDHG